MLLYTMGTTSIIRILAGDSRALMLSDISCLDVKAKLALGPTTSRRWSYTRTSPRLNVGSTTLFTRVSIRVSPGCCRIRRMGWLDLRATATLPEV